MPADASTPPHTSLDQVAAARNLIKRLRRLRRAADSIETASLDPITAGDLRHVLNVAITALNDLNTAL